VLDEQVLWQKQFSTLIILTYQVNVRERICKITVETMKSVAGISSMNILASKPRKNQQSAAIFVMFETVY